jgi:hypothetical protein
VLLAPDKGQVLSSSIPTPTHLEFEKRVDLRKDLAISAPICHIINQVSELKILAINSDWKSSDNMLKE